MRAIAKAIAKAIARVTGPATGAMKKGGPKAALVVEGDGRRAPRPSSVPRVQSRA